MTMTREDLIKTHVEMWGDGCELSYLLNNLFDEAVEWARTTKPVFQLYWQTGEHEEVSGDNIADAFSLAGYSRGALGALSLWDPSPTKDYEWSPEKKDWVRIETEE